MDPIPPNSAANATARSAQAQPDTGLVTSDFQTFLTMLTAQMQNQDPLNPMDSTDFATQLATFSGVEQQVRTNDLLTQLQSDMALMNMGQLSGWIGRQARAEMPVSLSGEPITLAAAPHPAATRAELVVKTGDGATVQRLDWPLSDEVLDWSGQDPDGISLPDDLYHLSIRSYEGDTVLEERAVQAYAAIEEAVLHDGETWLTMTGGISILASAVQAVRAPPTG